jgi:hypothetical protein
MRTLLGAMLAGALLVAGCGGDDDDTDADPATTSSDDTSAPTSEADAETESGTDATGTDGADATTTTLEESATTTSLGPPALDETSTVSTVGLDEVTFGMSLAGAQAAAGTVFVPEGPAGRCTVYVPEQGPTGIRFTVFDGAVERVDILDGPIRTRSGIGVGSPVADVYARYGAQAQPAPRADGSGEDIVFVPQDETDAAFRVIFETDGAVVTSFRSGRVPLVLPSTPCSPVQLPSTPAPTPS